MTAIPTNPLSTQPASTAQPADAGRSVQPIATQSLHGEFLEASIPQWLSNASAHRREAFKAIPTALPAWYQSATPARRKTLDDTFKASVIAQNNLDKSMAKFQDVETFAKPLVVKALKDKYALDLDVDKTLLCLRRAVEIGIQQIELASFEVLKISLLEAALHNFEADECEGTYHSSSGFVEATSTAQTFEHVNIGITVSQFLHLCRDLDIGQQYQTYLQGFFHPEEAVAEAVLAERFIASQKATMRAAAEQALLQKDIEAADHAMILSVIDGQMHPWMGEKQVWFKDLGLMKKRLTGCVAFVICKKYRYTDELILYIPHDPEHPLKRYTFQQMRDELKRLLTARDASQQTGAEPTAYQRFLSQFLAYDQRPGYFSQFRQQAADSPGDAWDLLRSPWLAALQGFIGGSAFTRIQHVPPERQVKWEPVADPYIAPSTVGRKGRGLWAPNEDLWQYLYSESRTKVMDDARSHAVPTAEVDARARDAKLAHLMQIGMLGLNMVSMFVPVLGEVMMVVMAGQLLYETLEGAVEWSEGDRRAAKDHLIDVAENLAQIAVMAGVGAGARKFSAARAVPVIEQLSPVTLPNGENRLWKPDLSGYEATAVPDASLAPNSSGQYTADGKTWIRQGNKVYEQVYDKSINQWRIKHPTDPEAYQPVLQSNGHGAWRHTLERPLQWDRLTLLRRMGHVCEPLSDTELLKAMDISGVSDDALRKMHLDHALPPPELTEAMRLLKTDAQAARVIEQLHGEAPVDDKYLYALPLVTDMPRWPANRVLEVFEGTQLTGKSVKYGAGYRVPGVENKAPIRISRADILGGNLPKLVLAGLDESEIVHLLGGQGARVPEARPAELARQIAAYAQTRQSAIYDSIYQGTEPVADQVGQLQKVSPGLSESAARQVLADATPEELRQFDATRRISSRMLEDARWYARRSRQVRAFAGLRSENIASADSRRLALHTLERLPGWPDNLRLEVREGSDSGPLLDSIGSQTAAQKKYLIKTGEQFQAFDDRGETLNSLPRHGDNFYASLMHALPDDARRGLGIPAVGQSAELQQKIIAHADQHYGIAPALLEQPAQWMKPPVRVGEALIGYPASGRAGGLDHNLLASLRDLYPGLTEQQASGFILEQLREGRTNREIFQWLQSRRHEWQQLEATLDEWSGINAAAPWERSDAGRKLYVAQALKTSWRNAPLAAHVPDADRLHLVVYDPLPTLTADFSHVRRLSIGGDGVTDGNADAFLAHFPRLEKLSLGKREIFDVGQQSLTSLPLSVTRMRSLKKLKLRTSAPAMATDFPQRLRTLTSLEELELEYPGFIHENPPALDLAALKHLKSLRIEALGMTQWPLSVQELPALERLNLARTSIASIPPALYIGHEKLWAGLSLNWSNFSHEAFTPAFEYVRSYSGPQGHLMDLNLMVRQYILGELNFLTGGGWSFDLLHQQIMTVWNTPETRLKAVELLRLEHAGIFRQFYQSTVSDGLRGATREPRWQSSPNSAVVRELERNWRASIRNRYNLSDPQDDPLVFELSGIDGVSDGPAISELASLPADTFAHVQTVRLDRLNVPVAQIQTFLRAFRGVRTLQITGCGLTEVPVRPADFAQLTRLDLTSNRITSTVEVQNRFDAFKKLELLNLRRNRLTALDVTAMPRLEVLDLSGNSLQTWPAGVENLPGLKWLDLRDNNLGSLPERVLASDSVLLKSHLTGNPLSVEAEAALTAARGRIEAASGLPGGALTSYESQPPGNLVAASTSVPETAFSRIQEFLLPLRTATSAAEGTAGLTNRLREINPVLSQEQAQQCIARLGSAGLGDAQIDVRIGEWRDSDEALTRQLNGWIFKPATEGRSDAVSIHSRVLMATKIRDCWVDGLTRHTEEAGLKLDLTGLGIVQLPQLSTAFTEVRTLDLTALGFSLQSLNDFCPAFPQLTTLVLNYNHLETLPESIGTLQRLEHLELRSNDFAEGPGVLQQMGDRLRSLDLSHNELSQFNASALSRLESLNLAHNSMRNWPDGVLALEHLHTLDLVDNRIAVFPDTLLGGDYEQLLAATDLSENRLTLNSLEQLRDFSAANANRDVMGYTRASLDRAITEFETTSESESGGTSDFDGSSGGDDDDHGGGAGDARRVDRHEAVEDDEVIANPQQDVDKPAMQTWLNYAQAQVRETRQALWLQLAREANHEAFFHLLSTLRFTADFRLSGADLTQRVWRVIEAATENTELRDLLFLNSATHGTCPDGRILSFSELETRVYEYTALRDIPRHLPEQRGAALVELTRRLFRLERVDRLAEAAGRHQDRAEIRLQYRIGMTRGWPDGLELPAQPEHMLYRTPIEGQQLSDARASVLADEASNLFLEDLIARDYWIRYMRDRYADVFTELDRDASQRQEAVEDAHPDKWNDDESRKLYVDAMSQLEIELAQARTDKLKELSRQELENLAKVGASDSQPRPASPQPGPSSRRD
ncbi:hypothetical protein GXB78_02865 [Pseudomonas moraviensis subsp. stanleyae]|uniref:dermonecrotic toxin domain-containing protein n=1 Tax=Pseudomonas moraviensis TaxID=321662 RepID=UPI002E37DBBB|nr:DUF6543 domain-containing protein [Pseudomonas moraviensis]MED7666154.1 hypothetical protein [Pseudomonas moraviensis subsp. stanleyae]